MSRLIPDTTAGERMFALERFMEFWLGPRRPEYGEPIEVLNSVQLPDPLRRLHAFAGRWPPGRPPNYLNRFFAQDRLLPLIAAPWGNVCVHGDKLIFAAECETVWIAATSASGDDPIVWMSEDYLRSNTEDFWCSQKNTNATWDFACDTLSHFLVTFMMEQLLLDTPEFAAKEGALEVFRDAGYRIEPVWLHAMYSSTKRWPTVRQSYYLIEDRILLRQFEGEDVALDDQWYGLKDPTAANLLENCGLPSSR